MSDHFERYHCQMALPGFGKGAQQLLQKARVLIVGMGGLGCPAAQYLTAAGIGTIGIADDDIVSISNLHRQILYTPEDIGLSKVKAASEKLQKQNPAVKIIPYNQWITSANVMDIISEFDLMIEGTDNFETKYLLNDACVLAGKPLIYGAIYQYEGQVGVWNILQPDGTCSPNYRDVFPDAEMAQVPNCAEGGVIPTLAGMVGCMQAGEAIKYLTNSADLLSGKLWIMNVQDGSTRIVHLKKKSIHQVTKLTETIPTLDFDRLQKEMESGSIEVIDVRTESEHRAFNIGGKNIPFDELKNHLDTLSFFKPVVCYCSSGKRSSLAARLIKNKFPEMAAYSLKGGIDRLRQG